MNPLLKKLQEIDLVQVSERAFPPPSGQGEQAHALSPHTPIWSYCQSRFANPYQATYRSTPLYALLPQSSSVKDVTRQTHFICMFGAASSSVLEELKQSPAVKLVFEPNEEALLQFIATQDIASLLSNQFFFFLGDCREYGWSLESIIPPTLTKLGFPAMYVQPGREEFDEYFQEMMKRIEFAYYRKRIYPATGQGGMRGLPFRPLNKGIFYDQEFHRLSNVIHTIKSGNPKYLANTHTGPAVLLGAGPGLKRRADLLQDDNFSIAVNSAYGFCRTQDKFPDITLISDTSIEAAQSIMGHKGKNPNALFGHWASGLGDVHFQNRYIGWEAPEVFGERPSLHGYGSVASAAFALAEFMGAEECVLSGIHLATNDPHGFSYASGQSGKYYQTSKKGTQDTGYHFPDLYPVRAADGSQLYTTLNFMDTAMVLRERMQQSGIRIINTDEDSLLYGEGITVDPDYIPPPLDAPKSQALISVKRDPINLALVDEMVGTWTSFYEEVFDSSRTVLAEAKPGSQTLALAEERIAFYDENSLSYILQRFHHFKNPLFHELFFDGKDTSTRLRGALYYFEHAHQLARQNIEILNDQRAQLHQLIREHGTMY